MIENLTHLSLYIALSLFFFFAGCGRKQKNFLYFPPEKTLNITKLDLPTIKGIKAQRTNIGTHISWVPLFTDKTPLNIKRFEKNFVGFDLFKLANNATFIPKKPINKKPITTNYFLDKQINKSNYAAYTIQPIFEFDNQIIHGPSSQIITANN